jgi:hypothetical protein
MSDPERTLDVSTMRRLLRQPLQASDVQGAFGSALGTLKRGEYYGSLNFPKDGFEAVFVEAPWILAPHEISDPKQLYIRAFLLHRAGHERHAGYQGILPLGLAFSEGEAGVLKTLGPPTRSGGGDESVLLQRTNPLWHRYDFADWSLHVQFDDAGTLEMVTLSAPEIRPQAHE